jgi:hypothetical protein
MLHSLMHVTDYRTATKRWSHTTSTNREESHTQLPPNTSPHMITHTLPTHMMITRNFTHKGCSISPLRSTPVHSKHIITSCVAEITIVDSSANHTAQITAGAKGES